MGEWTAETAEWYADKYGEYATNRLGIDALDLAAATTVVDIGCGTGAALRHLAESGSEATLIGVDPVARMVEIARERLPAKPPYQRIEFRQGSASAIPLESGSADVLLAFDSFDHWSDKAAGLAEVRRVLRPSGQFAMVKDGGAPGGGEAREAVQQALQHAGFTVLREEDIAKDDVTFTLWLARPSA